MAELAGVSVATVSKALNGRGRVDRQTRHRVTRAAIELGYPVAGAPADAAAPARPRTIGLALPEIAGLEGSLSTVDFYLRVSVALGDAAMEAGDGLLMLPRARDATDLQSFALDAAIVADPEVGDRRLAALDELGVPVVTLGRDLAQPERPWWVSTDLAADLRALLDHVEERGGRSVALLSAAMTPGWVATQEAAYTSWCAERRLRPLVVRLRADDAATQIAALLDGPERIDAIVSLPGLWLEPLLAATRERGLAVPGDLLVACASDGARPREADPPVTAIDEQPDVQALAALELLRARLDGDATEETRVTPSALVVRASTG